MSVQVTKMTTITIQKIEATVTVPNGEFERDYVDLIEYIEGELQNKFPQDTVSQIEILDARASIVYPGVKNTQVAFVLNYATTNVLGD